jgi:hypothetical protein
MVLRLPEIDMSDSDHSTEAAARSTAGDPVMESWLATAELELAAARAALDAVALEQHHDEHGRVLSRAPLLVRGCRPLRQRCRGDVP